MILTELRTDREAFRRRTGWEFKPEGACKGPICVPMDQAAVDADGVVDVRRVADRLGMPLVHEEAADLWALGPDSVSGRVLTSVEAPELELPTFDGRMFRLRSLLGRKVVVVSWASW